MLIMTINIPQLYNYSEIMISIMTTAINRKHNSTFLDVSEPRGQCGLSGMRPESEQMRPESEPEALKPEISGGRYDQIHQISKGPLETSVWVGGLAGARFSANLISTAKQCS